MNIGEYTTKANRQQAVQITRENLGELANWCGGKVHSESKSSDPSDIFEQLWVPTINGLLKLDVGDWLLKSHNDGQFRGMADGRFQKEFNQVGSRGDNPFPKSRGAVEELAESDSLEGSLPEPSGHIRDDFEPAKSLRDSIFGRRNVPRSRRPDYDDSVIEPSRVRDGDEMPIQSTLSEHPGEGWRNASYGDTNLGETRGS